MSRYELRRNLFSWKWFKTELRLFKFIVLFNLSVLIIVLLAMAQQVAQSAMMQQQMVAPTMGMQR